MPISQEYLRKNGIKLMTGWYDGWYSKPLSGLKSKKTPKTKVFEGNLSH